MIRRRLIDAKREEHTQSSNETSSIRVPKWSMHNEKQWLYACFIIFGGFCLAWLSYWGWNHEPVIIRDNPWNLGQFSAERAFYHVEYLSEKVGPRAFGTKALERAQQYIWHELERIKTFAESNTRYQVQLDLQVVSGTYLTKRSRYSSKTVCSTYTNVTNIIAIICNGPCNFQQGCDKNILVVNGHVDSALSSPGASDDAASCGVMLEILSSLVLNPVAVLKHPVVFLFNGAEETFLNGAHGFVKDYHLKEKIGALLNLESSGSGDWHCCFVQDLSMLAEAYARSVTRPHTSAVAQDIFEKELVPSETDFRVFWEVAEVPGIDLANYINGETYHTFRDAADRVTFGFLQHMGDSAMQLMEKLVGASDVLCHARNDWKNEEAVYYDVLGKFTIFGLEKNFRAYYFVLLLLVLMTFTKKFYSCSLNCLLLVSFYPVWMVTCLVCLLCGVSFGWLLYIFHRSMVWYGRTWLAELSFGSLAIFLTITCLEYLFGYIYSVVVVHTGEKKQARRHVSSSSPEKKIAEHIWLSYLAFQSTLLLICILLKLSLSYLSAWNILFLLLSCNIFPHLDHFHGLFNFVPISLFSLPCAFLAVAAFIPIMGRIGEEVVSDLIIGGMCSVFSSLGTFPLVIELIQYQKTLIFMKRSLVILFIISVVCIGSIRIPYDSLKHPKRIFINHVFVWDSEEQLVDQGVFLQGMDSRTVSKDSLYHDLHPVDNFFEEYNNFTWGFSSYTPWLMKGDSQSGGVGISISLASEPFKKLVPKLLVLEDLWNEDLAQRHLKLRMTFQGANFATFSLNASLHQWSLSETIPYRSSKGFISVRHFQCHDCSELEFWLVSNGSEKIAFDLNSIHLRPSPEQQWVIESLPKYVSSIGLQVHTRSFVV
eukprot:jgi/Galph1/1330/GphlegSOOS_G5993.1